MNGPTVDVGAALEPILAQAERRFDDAILELLPEDDPRRVPILARRSAAALAQLGTTLAELRSWLSRGRDQ